MLDRARLAGELERLADSIFINSSEQVNLARHIWQQIVADPTFVYKIRQVDAPWPIPTWEGKLDEAIAVTPRLSGYRIISVDGSQIYPDRHQGMSCFLINIGSVFVEYSAQAQAVFYSAPYVFSGEELHAELEPSPEVVNCRRQELELQAGFEQAQSVMAQGVDALPLVLLFDGSLIFWHLEAKDPALKDAFLSRYLGILYQLYQQQVITASYISMSKSRELVNLIRLQLCDFNPNDSEKYKPIERVIDATVSGFFLSQYERSIVFKNHANVSELYPDAVHPHFFYLHVGNEIGRVEIPAWVAQDEQRVDLVAQTILDQCIKGRGYPVVLAEAHEQAVVKGPDRDFFYHVLHKIGMGRQIRPTLSQKVIKKRGIGI